MGTVHLLHCSCETQLVEFVRDLPKAMYDAHQTDVPVKDFRETFDKVDHQRQPSKLQWYGTRGHTHRWIQQWLHCRTQVVVVDGEQSNSVLVSPEAQKTVPGTLVCAGSPTRVYTRSLSVLYQQPGGTTAGILECARLQMAQLYILLWTVRVIPWHGSLSWPEPSCSLANWIPSPQMPGPSHH